MMNIKIAATYQAMSWQAAYDLVQLLKSKEKPLICVASGHTPAGLYQELIKIIRQQQLDVSSWNFIGLDEWAGMNAGDSGSCQFHLHQQLFEPLGISQQQICFFNGRTEDGEAECRRVEAFIAQNGGIEVAILGLGLNGHIGMNEPGTPATTRSHVASIDALTQQIGQKYFSTPQTLSQGLTLGLATLLEAKHLLLLVNGTHKASIVKQVLSQQPSPALPATLLASHPGLTFYLDKEAAQLLQPQSQPQD